MRKVAQQTWWLKVHWGTTQRPAVAGDDPEGGDVRVPSAVQLFVICFVNRALGTCPFWTSSDSADPPPA
ncbi:hypothetical protein [Streptomyces bobili]